MDNGERAVKLSRKELYDEVWELSIAGVARKYNLNYPTLIKAFKNAEIPYPSSGYWTRLNMGKDVSAEKSPLTGDENAVLSLELNDSNARKNKKRKTDVKLSRNKEAEQDELIPEKTQSVHDSSISVTDDNAKKGNSNQSEMKLEESNNKIPVGEVVKDEDIQSNPYDELLFFLMIMKEWKY